MVTANWSSCLDHLEKHHFLIKNHFGHFLKNIGLILIPSTGHTVKNVLITLGSLSRVFKQRFLSVRGPMEKVMEVEFNKFLLLNQDNKLKRIAFCQRERERERDRVCVLGQLCVCVCGCVNREVNVKTFIHYFINIVKTNGLSRPECQDRAKLIPNVSKWKLSKFWHWSWQGISLRKECAGTPF